MSEETNKMTNKEVAQWQEELLKLEPNCSTGKLGTPQEQKQKIDALLARARARKKLANG
ncbi:MAG: hypothetical protein N4J56_002909 [Chroococcidiopsis sp. SAG 2025]|nr:hypothetical protein [Chroococcidiopsis sp. SAG 2025]